MASNVTALAERNERVKYARALGVVKPHTLKREALEAAIAKAVLETLVVVERCETCGKSADLCVCDGDPFDDIDPTLEGDHLLDLTADALPEVETVAEAMSLRDSVREVWLMDAVDEIKGLYRQAGFSEVDNHPVLISTGFPHGNVRKVIGQCHAAESNEGRAHIFINPTQDDTMRVLEIVAHELAHAPGYHGHTGDFRRMAASLLRGTGGKNGTGFTSTDVNEDSVTAFEDIAAKLGPYPHTKVNVGMGAVKKQTTRMLKAQCGGKDVETEDVDESGDTVVERIPCELADDSGNGYVIRLTKKWAEVGLPTCPCGGEMTLEEKDGE